MRTPPISIVWLPLVIEVESGIVLLTVGNKAALQLGEKRDFSFFSDGLGEKRLQRPCLPEPFTYLKKKVLFQNETEAQYEGEPPHYERDSICRGSLREIGIDPTRIL